MDSLTDIASADYFIFSEKKLWEPSHQMPLEHYHRYHELFYLKKGNCYYTIDGAEYTLNTGDFMIIPPQASHMTRYGSTSYSERYVFYFQKNEFPAEFWEKYPEISAMLDKACKITLIPQKQQGADRFIQRILQENSLMDKYSSESIRCLLLCLLISLKRDGAFLTKKRPERVYSRDISEAIEFITQNFFLPLTLKDTAKRAGLSSTYFSRKFHMETSLTFKEYLTKIRILNAKQMLLTTRDSITVIAANCGFSSSNYFKDVFRQITGLSPVNYRKKGEEDYGGRNGL